MSSIVDYLGDDAKLGRVHTCGCRSESSPQFDVGCSDVELGVACLIYCLRRGEVKNVIAMTERRNHKHGLK
jgi:hypothetical protein